MAEFMTDLFQSIFTPGPTSSLLIATNVAFACLQAVLGALLLATWSIHFAILSFLSAGLWWAINWFVAELKLHEMAEKEKERREKEAIGGDAGEDTETEGEREREKVTLVGEHGGLGSEGVRERVLAPASGVSTEDEWERVEEGDEKDK